MQIKFSFFLVLGFSCFSLLNSCSKGPQNFIEFLYFLGDQSEENRQEIFSDWVKTQKSFPVIENDKVFFIYKNEQDLAAYVCGDFNNWAKDSLQFLRIIGTSFYYAEASISEDARVKYVFYVKNRFITDALNGNIKESANDPVSILMMPAYEYPVETLLNRFQRYTILDTVALKSDLLKDEVIVFLYKHPHVQAASPIIIFSEGEKYLNYARAQIILDNLVDLSKIPPCYGIFVKSGKIEDNGLYFKMMFDELLPAISGRFNLNETNPVIIGGASAEVLFSLGALKNYASRIKSVFWQSFSSGNLSVDIMPDLYYPDLSAHNVFLSGSAFSTPDTVTKIWQDFLSEKKAYFRIKLYNEGENWENYSGHLDEALIFLINKNPLPN